MSETTYDERNRDVSRVLWVFLAHKVLGFFNF